jgi:putative acetyltransferase
VAEKEIFCSLVSPKSAAGGPIRWAANEEERLIQMNTTIKIDDLSDPRIARFLEEHLNDMQSVTPPESCHALDLDALRRPEITFWSVWNDDELVGCGALKMLTDIHAELKSMRTSAKHRGTGLGTMLLQHIISEARRRGIQQISLETGAIPFFDAARALYEKNGFEYCGPFNGYKDDPNCVFMSREITKP